MTRRNDPRHPLEWYRDPDGRGVDARLHLLDRQMLDTDRVPVSTVDDVELSGIEIGDSTEPEHPPVVAALLVGAAVLPRIFGGRIPRSQWNRIPWDVVAKVHTAIDLRVHADDLDATWTEQFARDRIVARIPGGRHAPE
ncbi:hypothetical protein G5T42_03460 [Microbacterium sp. 4R-513]|uniref:hypothetical protein n=1 Tax=Microbacterium sp. 4R-513 TaxID=2567934 RepID=UPI0013E13EE2|nr:hypothetical protein [Microbacterium sp. 4R-513]QIG38657.1 hypothetical protein G5T42_03460 [Microbacterium sp. 4R-513]